MRNVSNALEEELELEKEEDKNILIIFLLNSFSVIFVLQYKLSISYPITPSYTRQILILNVKTIKY